MKRYPHDLSFEHSLSVDMGALIPLGAIDVLPGDTFINKAALLARVAPLAKPVMHDCEIRVHNWFVPNRIIWDDWEEFIVGNEAGHTYPTITPANLGIIGHMGIEPVPGAAIDGLPLRAYNLIYNEFYRDQDLSAVRGQNDSSLARISWGKDYFTTARATPQQGAAIEVGFSAGEAPLGGIGAASVTNNTTDFTVADGEGTTHTGDAAFSDFVYFDRNPAGNINAFADLSQATGGIDINELRDAISMQRIVEARSFFGSRYVDYLRWYGVNPRDGRLDRPEYLGGGKQRISFSEVLSTAQTTDGSVGDLFGHGIAGLRSRPHRKMFEEHGWMISLLSVRPRGVYQTGIPRRFLRTQPEDFWHRELELLPWQAVKTQEIWGAADPEDEFGFAPRYDEYRETQSYVSGTFRGGTEEDWTLARSFASEPTLNQQFVQCEPSDRIYQDTNMPELLIHARMSIKARRLVAANARMSNRAGL